MPTGLLGGVCKGCQEDRDGLRNWEDTCHEGVGRQCVWKSSLVALLQAEGFDRQLGLGSMSVSGRGSTHFFDFGGLRLCVTTIFRY